MSHRSRLIFVISVLLVVGFLITSLASYWVSLASLRVHLTESELPLTSDNIYSEIQRDLLRPVLISSFMASDTFLRDWVLDGEQDTAELTQYLREVRSRYGTVTSFFVSERTRVYYHPGGILKRVSTDEPRDEWYFRVREMSGPYEINVDPDMANADAMTIFINHRVYDYDEKYIGAAGVGLTVNAVTTLIARYQSKYHRTIYFIDDSGAVMLSGAGFPATVSNVLAEPAYEGFAGEFRPVSESAFSYRRAGDRIHTNVRYIPEFGWYLVVEEAEGASTRAVSSTLFINLGICAAITLVVLVLVNRTITSYRERINTLQGIVPICSYCKQVRDDKGYWNQVEAYVAKHSEAEFSHGICPDCMTKYFPEYADDDMDEALRQARAHHREHKG